MERRKLYAREYRKEHKDAANLQNRKSRQKNRDAHWKEGERIRQIRKAAGMTQYDVAARLGVAQPTISSWENGTYPARYDLLREVFGKEMDEVEKLCRRDQI